MKLLILSLLLFLSACSALPPMAEEEKHWQVMNGLAALQTGARPECTQGRIPTFAGLVVGPDTGTGQIAGAYVLNAVVHYSVTKLLYYYAPDRYWRAWHFATKGATAWDMSANYVNCR